MELSELLKLDPWERVKLYEESIKSELLKLNSWECVKLYEESIKQDMIRTKLSLLKNSILFVARHNCNHHRGNKDQQSQFKEWYAICCFFDHWYEDHAPELKTPCYCTECQNYIFN